MAYYYCPLLVLFLCLITPCAYSHDKAIDNLLTSCQNQTASLFCKALQNIQEGKDHNVTEEVHYAITAAIGNAEYTLSRIHLLIPHIIDVLELNHYKTCSKCYNKSLTDLKRALKACDEGDFSSLNAVASSVLSSLVQCAKTVSPGANAAALKPSNEKMADGVVTIVVLSSFLVGGNDTFHKSAKSAAMLLMENNLYEPLRGEGNNN